MGDMRKCPRCGDRVFQHVKRTGPSLAVAMGFVCKLTQGQVMAILTMAEECFPESNGLVEGESPLRRNARSHATAL